MSEKKLFKTPSNVREIASQTWQKLADNVVILSDLTSKSVSEILSLSNWWEIIFWVDSIWSWKVVISWEIKLLLKELENWNVYSNLLSLSWWVLEFKNNSDGKIKPNIIYKNLKKTRYTIIDKKDDFSFTTRTIIIWNQSFNVEINNKRKISCISNDSWIALNIYNIELIDLNNDYLDMLKLLNNSKTKDDLFNIFLNYLENWLFDEQLDKVIK